MKLSTVLKIFAIFIVAVFVINQIVSAIVKPFDTESAVYYTATEGFKINATIIRNEVLITSDNVGVLHFIVSDGEKVAKDGVVANIYDSETASIAASKAANIKAKIDDITDVMSYNDVDAVNLDLISSKVTDNVNNLIINSSNGKFEGISACEDELLSSLNRKQAALGISADFSAQLEQLNSEYNAVATNVPAAKGNITAPKSGYFVSEIDGFENVLTTADLSAVTPEFLTDAKPEELSQNIIGKIVSDYEWYIAAKMSINNSLGFKEGETMKIATSLRSASELPVTVQKVNTSAVDDSAVVIFRCNQMNGELAAMRSGLMTVIKAKYEGIKVSRKALRVVDSQKGVYVLSGMELKFVPVEIKFYGEDYIICKKPEEDSQSSIKLYDQVVTDGKNLYDGKIVG